MHPARAVLVFDCMLATKCLTQVKHDGLSDSKIADRVIGSASM
jgi:hypothetical protein